MKIPLSRASIAPQTYHYVKSVLHSGWLGEGTKVALLEARIAALTGARYAVACNTGTAALHCALRALGVGKGDEVVVPSLTFASDPMAVVLCGAQPVFCDIDPDTLLVTPETVVRCVTKKTKVIMPTDFAGFPCDVRALRKHISRHVFYVRDASHSFGSVIDQKMIGVSAGEDITCFSFDPIKNLTCGEGGMALCNRSIYSERMKMMRRLGFSVHCQRRALTRHYHKDHVVVEEGYRYHMSDINAAIGIGQLQSFAHQSEKRKCFAKMYDEFFAHDENIIRFQRDYTHCVPFMYVVRVMRKRTELIRYLHRQGIEALIRYAPCHTQPFFAGKKGTLRATERIADEILSLPLFPAMKKKDVYTVVHAIKQFYKRR